MAIQEAPPAPPAGPMRPHHRRAWWTFALIGVAALGLTAGLLVWAPWHTVPVAPAAVVGQSPTATSVQVSWAPSKGGSTIDRYLIMRDGAQVGSVPARQTSYLDHGLAPGTTHRYRIIAVSGTQRSQPSVSSAVVRTITPSPVGLQAGAATWTTVAFHWSPPPNSPAPDGYVISSNDTTSALPGAATLPGTATSYTATGLDPATDYQFQVAATWGGQQSDLSSVLTVTTQAPPLQGDVPMQVKTLSTPGGGASLKVGQTWSDSWTFTATCTAKACTLKADAEFAPPDYGAQPFTVTLTSSGAAYTGSAKADITKCGSVDVHNTVTVRIAAKKGAVNNGAWKSWAGTMLLSAPYVDAGDGTYCPAQSWNFSLSGTQQ